MRVLFALAILLTCGFCQEADLEQKNLENNLSDNPSLRYRCPVKDKFLNRANSFDSYRDIGSWQDCGKCISDWKLNKIFHIFPRINLRQNSGEQRQWFLLVLEFHLRNLLPLPSCNIAVLYQYQYQRDHLIGQSTTTQLAQIKTQWTSLEPSVEREGVWNKSWKGE